MNFMLPFDSAMNQFTNHNIVKKLYNEVGKLNTSKYIRNQCKEGVVWKKSGNSYKYNPQKIAESFAGKSFKNELIRFHKIDWKYEAELESKGLAKSKFLYYTDESGQPTTPVLEEKHKQSVKVNNIENVSFEDAKNLIADVATNAAFKSIKITMGKMKVEFVK